MPYLYLSTTGYTRKTVRTNYQVTYRQHYLNGFEFRQTPTGNAVIEAVHHSEGRVAYTAGANPRYEYSIKDHLGNTRLTFCDLNSDGAIQTPSEILQENHYYPFGLALNGPWMNNAAPDNLYQYNGKELQPDHGLGWYDYGARMYMPELGRWNGVDALGDHPNQNDKSTYAYAWNNPSNLTDPDGNCPTCAAGAIIGGAVGFIVGASQFGFRNGGWKKVLASTAGGAVTGLIAGTGVGAAGLIGIGGSAAGTGTFTIIGTTIGAVAGEGVEQGVNML